MKRSGSTQKKDTQTWEVDANSTVIEPKYFKAAMLVTRLAGVPKNSCNGHTRLPLT